MKYVLRKVIGSASNRLINAMQPSAPLDEPFHDVVGEVPAPSSTISPPAATTPTGFELIFGDECEEVTRVYPKGFIESLRQEASAHTHGTLPSMQAVRL